MTDYQKAREAAIKALHAKVTFHDSAMLPEEEQQEAERGLDAALSAFEVRGLVLMPMVASIEMIAAMANANAKHGGMATPSQEYAAMVNAALKERQKK